MKILMTRVVLLTGFLAIPLIAGCSGVGGPEGGRKAGYSESAAEIYQIGSELGTRDALSRLPSDYTRHLKSFDSPFIAQFESGYRKGYGRVSP